MSLGTSSFFLGGRCFFPAAAVAPEPAPAAGTLTFGGLVAALRSLERLPGETARCANRASSAGFFLFSAGGLLAGALPLLAPWGCFCAAAALALLLGSLLVGFASAFAFASSAYLASFPSLAIFSNIDFFFASSASTARRAQSSSPWRPRCPAAWRAPRCKKEYKRLAPSWPSPALTPWRARVPALAPSRAPPAP